MIFRTSVLALTLDAAFGLPLTARGSRIRGGCATPRSRMGWRSISTVRSRLLGSSVVPVIFSWSSRQT